MSEFRDKFKKATGENCKTVARYDVENQSDIDVKMFNHRYVDWLERKLANEQATSKSNCNIPLVTASYFDKIQKGFKKLQEDCTEVRLVGFCQKEEIPDEAHREEFEEEFDHEYQLTQSDGYDEASFWGDIYLQLDGTLYMRFDVIG